MHILSCIRQARLFMSARLTVTCYIEPVFNPPFEKLTWAKRISVDFWCHMVSEFRQRVVCPWSKWILGGNIGLSSSSVSTSRVELKWASCRAWQVHRPPPAFEMGTATSSAAGVLHTALRRFCFSEWVIFSFVTRMHPSMLRIHRRLDFNI